MLTLILALLLVAPGVAPAATAKEASLPWGVTKIDQPAALVGLMVNPERLAGARGNTFLATVGEKLHRYWKVNKHWLVALRNFLARPFDYQVMMALGQL